MVSNNKIGTDISGESAVPNGVVGVLVDLSATRTTLSKNVVSGNVSTGIWVASGAVETVMTGNTIGLNASRTSAIPNGLRGIDLGDGVTKTRIGTNGDGQDDATEGNIIAGNVEFGISLWGSSIFDTTIAGNSIGVVPESSQVFGNGNGGIRVVGAKRTRIGTDGSNDAFNQNEANVISGNGGFGISISAAEDTVVAGNIIGLDSAGSLAIGNASLGVSVIDASNRTRIGTNGDGIGDSIERNVISANLSGGIEISSSNETVIAGNVIGLASNGIDVLGNSGNGINVTLGPRIRELGPMETVSRIKMSEILSPGIRFVMVLARAAMVLSSAG